MAFVEGHRKDYVRNVLLNIGGPYLENTQIQIVENPKGGNSIAQDGKRIVHLALRKDFVFGPVDMLTAVVVHEFANTKVPLPRSLFRRWEISLSSSIAVSRRTSRFTRSLAIIANTVSHSVFEGLLFGWLRILNFKLQVDQCAVDILREQGLDIGGYQKFLEKELEDRNNFPIPRRWWHRYIVKKRIRVFQTQLRFVQ